MEHQGASPADFDMEQFIAENPDVQANPFAAQHSTVYRNTVYNITAPTRTLARNTVQPRQIRSVSPHKATCAWETPEFDGSEFQTTPAEADRVMRNLFPDVPLPTMESCSPYVGRPLNNGPTSANTRAKSLSPFDPALLDPRLFFDAGAEGLLSTRQGDAGTVTGGPAMRTRSKSLSPERVAEEGVLQKFRAEVDAAELDWNGSKG
ncbi:hypothetical protein B0A48_10072 [Cryoendolithus antarcticus]|uniref:Uncharacterized protein n=1 Tax=Cryoendolithus antarcticus TaxID=1507870 RepID=A0A1V8T3J0_9PEZI|nr:hypothetical protein B0A48_10072 [Cryoendolithus antarcticus]